MAASKNKHSYRSPQPKTSDQTTTKQEHPDQHTHTQTTARPNDVTGSEHSEAQRGTSSIHTPRGLDALPIHLTRQNRLSVPSFPWGFGTLASSRSQVILGQSVAAATGSQGWGWSESEIGLNLQQSVPCAGPPMAAEMQSQACLPLPNGLSLPLKVSKLLKERGCPSCRVLPENWAPCYTKKRDPSWRLP